MLGCNQGRWARFQDYGCVGLTALTLSFAIACGGGANAAGSRSLSATAGTDEASSGAEQPAANPGSDSETAGAVASGGSQAGPGSTPAAGGSNADSGSAKPAAKDEPSPWGSPEADSGKPLPARSPMAAGAKSSYDSGVARSRAGDNAGAGKAFEKALASDKNNYLILYNLGVVADHDGKEDKALDYYKKSLAAQADFEGAAAGMVAIYVRRGQDSRAESFLRPLAEKWERNLYLQALYADLLTHMGQPREAADAARGALRRDEKFVPAMLSLAKANLSEGKTELAESILEQAEQVDPNNAELHYLKGNQLLEDGQLAPALAAYREAVRLRPDYPEARMALGIRLLAGANYDGALTQFKAVEKLSPTLVEVHVALGDAYRASREWEKAKASFDRALKMKSELPEAHYNLGLMYLTAGEQYPGMDMLQALDAAKREFQTYRSMKGGKLGRDDLSGSYLEDIDKRIERENKRIERDERRKQQEAERAARQAAEGEEGSE